MSAEPNHKMEDQLKAYAQKRRADAGDSLELHPATRRLLQAEVAKLRPNPPAASRSWLWAWRMFWARPGFALLLFLMLGVAAWFLLRTAEKPRSREQFAKRRTDLAPVPALSETGRDKSQALPPAPTKALDFSEGRTADELELKQQAAPAAKNESGDDVRRNFTIATPAATPLSTAGKEVKLVEELAHNQPLPLAAEPSLGDSAARTGNSGVNGMCKCGRVSPLSRGKSSRTLSPRFWSALTSNRQASSCAWWMATVQSMTGECLSAPPPKLAWSASWNSA